MKHILGLPHRWLGTAFTAFILLIVAYGIYAMQHPSGFSVNTITTNVNQGGALAFAAMGQSIVLLSGGIDLSIGSILVLVRSVASHVLHGSPLEVAVGLVACLGVGFGAGIINGAIVVYGRIQPVIATLATGAIYAGVALAIRPRPGGDVSEWLGDALTYEADLWLPEFLGDTFLGNLPSAAIAIGLTVLLVWMPIRHAMLGRKIIAVGSSSNSARISGIAVDRVSIMAYGLGGLFAAFGGIFLAALTLTGDANAVQSGYYTLNSLAASVIGGTSLLGGVGGVLGAVFGAYLLSMMASIMRVTDKILGLIEASPLVQPLIEGLVLLIAISVGAAGALKTKNRLFILGQADRSRESHDIWAAVRLSCGLVAVLLVIASAVLISRGETPPFFSPDFLLLQLQSASFLAMFAVGAFLVIKIGQIDLSLPWAITACAMIATSVGGTWAIPIAVGVGAMIGLLNGLGVAVLRIPSIIFTLGVNSILLGLMVLLTGGFAPRSEATDAMVFLGADRSVLFLPNSVFAALAVILAMAWFLRRSRIGREIEAIGFSEGAAYLSGVRTPLVIIGVFMVAGMCTGFGASLLTGFSGKAFQDMGSPYLMPAIAAVVLGGTRITGGSGHLIAVIMGVLVVTLLQSTLAVVQIPSAWRQILYGAILIAILIAQNSATLKLLMYRRKMRRSLQADTVK
ncbi:ABC transporter permease [Shimia abyssi]|uniref:Autoinducer 2 import system permease protein LsrC n=1 Tax=Shimia abyssi TaxID=1662395 RepID=A0A2P8F0Y3_9RHOB|nr:ABC transporter permease [Shimia abyssi]PSL15358.1 ribose transport system permease protein [Shimia abyssi]